MKCLSLVLVAALAGAVFAGPASAKTSKRAVRASLLKQVKKNPNVLKRASFIRKANHVDFKLPVTIRLNPYTFLPNALCAGLGKAAGCAGPITTGQLGGLINSNDSAALNLGSSLGTKAVSLGGQVKAYVVFNDPLDGGNIGDVRLQFVDQPAGSTDLQVNPVSLLKNPDVTTQTTALGGCTDRGLASSVYYGGNLGAVPGYQNWDATAAPGNPTGIDVDDYRVSNVTGTGMIFPGTPYMGASIPGPNTSNNNYGSDTVLRASGPVSAGNPNGNLGVGVTASASGGTANLLAGNVNVNLALPVRIWSILRSVDAARSNGVTVPTNITDPFDINCRQAWGGYIDSTLNANVAGAAGTGLKIAPAFTLDRRLRIAKVNLSGGETTHNTVSACLQPYTSYAAEGTPAKMFAKATPSSSIGSALPTTKSASQRARQEASSTLPRYSKAMPRMMIAKSRSISGVYIALNIVA